MKPNGILFMFIASFLFALMNVLVKFIPGIPAVEIVFFRSIVSLALSWYFLRRAGVSIWGNNRKLLVARGIYGSVALILAFYLLQKIPLASAITILYMSPVFTTILGIFMVGERVRSLTWIFFAIAFGGILVIQGFDPRIDLSMLLIGLISTIFMGLAYNTIKIIGIREHPLVVIFYFPLVAMPFTGIYSAANWVMPAGVEWVFLILIGVVVQAAQYFMTVAYQHEKISTVVSIKYFGIIYALVFGWVFFDEHFQLSSYLGMVAVMVGVLGNILYTQKFGKSKD